MRLRLSVFASIGWIIVTGAALAPGAYAGRLPEWARPIAESAPPVAEGVSKYPARALFTETRYAVQPDGSLKIRRRFATQALSVNSEDVGLGRFDFDDTAKVTASRAWHVPPGEGAKRSWGPPVDIAVGGYFLDDAKARFVVVEGIKKGSIVFFEFEAIEKPRFLTLREIFYEDQPLSLARFELETPPGWAVQSVWLRRPGPDPVVTGNVRAWELKDLPAPEEEDLGASPIDQAPMLIVGLLPPAGVKVEPAVFTDWASLSIWYEDLARGRREVTPGIEAAAKKAVGGAEGDFFERIRLAGKFVRDSVRYVAVELGVGGYQPRPAADTLANLYGDCKDKATLLQALLAVEGISSYPVLINSSLRDTVSEEVPAWTFNHAIAAVALPDGVAVPPAFAPAVVEAGELGKVLMVDTTDERTSIGSLSSHLAGKQALVVAGAKGRLVTLPAGDASLHRIERKIRMTLAPTRALSVGRLSRYSGEFAWHTRDHFSSSSVERRKTVERAILRVWPDATLADYSAEYETADGAFTEEVTFNLRPPSSGAADAKLEMFPGASGDLDRVPLGKRKTAVSYGHPLSIRYEMTFEGFPESAALPAAQDLRGEGWSVTTTFARDSGVIRATWEVVLNRTHFEPDAFPELRKFWSAAASAANWMLSPSG